MKKNVLVFPCGSEIGLEIHRSLNVSTHFVLFGASSVDDHGKFVYSNYICGMPYVDDADFANKLNKIIDDHKIDYVIPAHDSVLLKLAQEKAAGSIDCEVITSPLKTCEIARSKQKTYEFFSGTVAVPHIFQVRAEPNKWPVFLKPDVGQGSKGTFIAKSVEDIIFYRQKDPGLLILEYLPGKEYTTDCFTSKNGKLLFCKGRERKRISGGISVNSEQVDDDRFKEIAEKINKNLTFRGAWFFQVKERDSGELVLMEIAPRIAGTMGLARGKGVNLVLLSLFDAMGYEVDVFDNSYHMVIDRALQNNYMHDIRYTHVYIDFDDLVLFEGKVNPYVMAFVYQCINKAIKVHLLTRHKEVLNDTLQKYRLLNTFDEIIWVTNQEDEKYKYIKEKDAIFIDDSFAERKKVRDNCGIPTFDGHMIEGLMEKFH
jgi:predicted ATP-grasp superfamily ATP-dependent carboligase